MRELTIVLVELTLGLKELILCEGANPRSEEDNTEYEGTCSTSMQASQP